MHTCTPACWHAHLPTHTHTPTHPPTHLLRWTHTPGILRVQVWLLLGSQALPWLGGAVALPDAGGHQWRVCADCAFGASSGTQGCVGGIRPPHRPTGRSVALQPARGVPRTWEGWGATCGARFFSQKQGTMNFQGTELPTGFVSDSSTYASVRQPSFITATFQWLLPNTVMSEMAP